MSFTAVAALLGGCKTVHTESFAGRDAGQVWTAMKAVAESPGYYDDWFVTENHVAVYEEEQRIEIHRELRRDLVVPDGGPQRESRAMDQTITLVARADDDEIEPVIKFVTAGPGIPARDEVEAELFFADVWDILGGAPVRDGDEEPGDESAEMIDIDEMND
jgi:hypothetical protein